MGGLGRTEGDIAELAAEGRTHLLQMDGLPDVSHDRQGFLAVGGRELMPMKIIEEV